MQNLNLIELIQQGWIATYPLILFSVLMVAILGERMFALSGVASTTRRLTGMVIPPLARGTSVQPFRYATSTGRAFRRGCTTPF